MVSKEEKENFESEEDIELTPPFEIYQRVKFITTLALLTCAVSIIIGFILLLISQGIENRFTGGILLLIAGFLFGIFIISTVNLIIKPVFIKYFNSLGHKMYKEEKYKEAFNYFDTVLKFAPHDMESRKFKEICFREKRKFEKSTSSVEISSSFPVPKKVIIKSDGKILKLEYNSNKKIFLSILGSFFFFSLAIFWKFIPIVESPDSAVNLIPYNIRTILIMLMWGTFGFISLLSMNYFEVVVDNYNMIVRPKPVPWFGGKVIRVADIKDVKWKKSDSLFYQLYSENPVFQVTITLYDKREVKLLSALGKKEEAIFISNELGRHLGIDVNSIA